MKVLISTILIICNFVYAEAPTFYEEQLQLAKTSATKGGIASGALVPFFWFLNKKSNLQLINTAPVSYSRSLIAGVKAVPNVATTLSIQFWTGELSKQYLRRHEFVNDEAYLEAIGCGNGAVFSAPWYAVMNGKTMGLSRTEALRGFFKNPFSTGWPIVGREFCFLFGVQVSSPFSSAMQQQFGESWFVENTSCFAAGFAGSIFGHPFDTWLTRTQANRSWHWRDLMKGGVTKAIGIGGFAVLFHHLKKLREGPDS
jgi:hypothetical protein